MQFSQSRDLKAIDVSRLQTDWNCPKVTVYRVAHCCASGSEIIS